MKLPFSVNVRTLARRVLGLCFCLVFLTGLAAASEVAAEVPIVCEARISNTAGQVPQMVTIVVTSYASTMGMNVEDENGSKLSGAKSSLLNGDGTKRFVLETRVDKPYTGEWYVYLRSQSGWIKTDTQFTVDFTGQPATPQPVVTPAPVVTFAPVVTPVPDPNALYVSPETRFKAEASSVYRLKYNKADYKVTADMAVDGNLQTAWNEGAKGSGIGEWIRLTPADGQKYTYNGFKIANGFQYHTYKKGDRWKKNNRVSSLNVYADGTRLLGTYAIEDMKDGYQTVRFDTPVECSFLLFEIADVWKGNEFQDTCISELAPF